MKKVETDPFIDDDDLEEKEDSRLLEGETKEDHKPACGTQSKLLLVGIAVMMLGAGGIVFGVTFSERDSHIVVTGLEKSDACTKGNLRLPQNIAPMKYRIYMHPNITDGVFGFSGNVKILIKVKTATDLVILHTKNLNILQTMVLTATTQDLLNAGDFPKVQIKRYGECKHFEQLIIKTEKMLPAGGEYVVHVGFSGTLAHSELSGFYLSSYTTKAGEERHLATTDFEPAGARSAFPCFDEPAMKAKFTVIMARNKNHSALSNMPIEKTEIRHQDGLEIDFFQESVPMSTYLVAFIVSDFTYLNSTTPKGGVEIRVWAPKEQINQAEYALDCALKILDFYNDFFKVKFPLPKLDLIAIPDFSAGAMENWGLVTYRMTTLLYDANESGSSSKEHVASTIAHEFAHQWFGDLVTMQWWNDLWLNEGFANFVEKIGANHITSSWKLFDQSLIDTERSMKIDSHVNSHPISVTVKDPAQVAEIFDGISYDKGSAVIGMMQDFLGKDYFHRGLKEYLNKYKYGNAMSNDLWAEMTKAHGNTLDVKSIMDTWTLQMGYPVVTVARQPGNLNVAVATQKHFISDVNSDQKPAPSPFNYTWDVPLTYHFENGKEERKWFYHNEAKVSISWKKASRWLKVNNNQIGFYRVNYDDANWDALTKQLQENHTILSPTDRAGLLKDAFALARAGEISTIRALNLTSYLKKEKEYIPYDIVMGALGYIGERLRERPGYKFYEKYIMQIVLPRVKELGWEDTGSHLNKYLRSSVLHSAVSHNESSSVAKARAMFDDWMLLNKSIAPNLRSTVYLAGIKYGDRKVWDFMFQKYMHSPFPAEKRKLMSSLALSANPEILQHLLEISLNNHVIKSQDSCEVIQHVAQNKRGRKLAIKFVKEHWDILYARYTRTSTNLGRTIKTVFGSGGTQQDFDDAKDFLTSHKLGSGTRAAKQALALIQNHFVWLKENEANVSKWLEHAVAYEQ